MDNDPTRSKILIVDDHPVVRRGLRTLLTKEPDFTVCGEAETAAEALDLFEELHPDLGLLDLALEEGMNGIELTKQLQSYYPDIPVMILSMYDESLYAERALCAGARGYIQKHAPDEEIIQAIRRVLNGRIYISEEIRGKLYPLEAGKPSQTGDPIDRLSDRELEVFLLLGKGYDPRHIAEELFVSVKTVETHRRRLKEKLNIDDASELRRYAVEWYKTRSPE